MVKGIIKCRETSLIQVGFGHYIIEFDIYLVKILLHKLLEIPGCIYLYDDRPIYECTWWFLKYQERNVSTCWEFEVSFAPYMVMTCLRKEIMDRCISLNLMSYLISNFHLQADDISGFHANTHIPIVVGSQRRYEITGDPLYKVKCSVQYKVHTTWCSDWEIGNVLRQ